MEVLSGDIVTLALAIALSNGCKEREMPHATFYAKAFIETLFTVNACFALLRRGLPIQSMLAPGLETIGKRDRWVSQQREQVYLGINPGRALSERRQESSEQESQPLP